MIKLPDIIGLPPKTEHTLTDTRLYDSMPLVKIYPMSLNLNKGIHFIKLQSGINEYEKLLNKYGYGLNIRRNYLQFAFLNEGSISESFSNDYGDSFFSKFVNTVSGGISEVRQMINARNFDDITKTFESLSKKLGDAVLGDIGGHLTSSAAKGITGLANEGRNFLKEKLGNTSAENLLIGNKLDMPQIWKGSSSSFDYNFTIRLYNPNPSDTVSYEKYIVGPIVSLLLFCMPRSNDGNTYRWPFYCKINAPGMFKINFGCFKDLSITKGGDSGVFTYSQQPTMVDIKISVSELYSVRIALEDDAPNENNVPTLTDYIESLKEKKNVSMISHYKPYEFSDNENIKLIEKKNKEEINTEKSIIKQSNKQPQKNSENRVSETIKKNIVPQIKKKKDQGILHVQKLEEKTERVIDTIKEKTDELKNSIKEKFTDPETGDVIIRIKENTLINLTKKKAIIDKKDFELESEFKKTVKDLKDKSYNLIIMDNREKTIEPDKKIQQNQSTFTLSAGQIVEQIGTSSTINHGSKTAYFNKNDFSTSYEFKNMIRTYKKKGYNVSYSNNNNNTI